MFDNNSEYLVVKDKGLIEKYKVESLPTLIILKNRVKVNRI